MKHQIKVQQFRISHNCPTHNRGESLKIDLELQFYGCHDNPETDLFVTDDDGGKESEAFEES
jgi:hypothetical protein